jgi:hypothetical protein
MPRIELAAGCLLEFRECTRILNQALLGISEENSMLRAQHQILVNRIGQIVGHASRLDKLNSGPRTGHLPALIASHAPATERDAILRSAVQAARAQSAMSCEIAHIWEQCFGILGATDQLGTATESTTPEAILELFRLLHESSELADGEGPLLPRLEKAKAALISIDEQIQDLAGLNLDLRALCSASIERSGAILGSIGRTSRAIASSLELAGLPATGQPPVAPS